MTKLTSILTSTHKGVLVAILGTSILGIASLMHADSAATEAAQPRQFSQEEIQQMIDAQQRAQQAQWETAVNAAKEQLKSITPEQEAKLQQNIAYMFAQQIRPDIEMLGLNQKEKDTFIQNITNGLNSTEEFEADPQTQIQAFAYFQMRAETSQLRQLEEAEKPYLEFLQGLDKRKEVITTPSGLKYEILQEGTGDAVQSDSIVSLHYKGSLPDGTVFDSSEQHGPMVLNIAQGRAIPGFIEGVKLGKKGSKLRLYIPAKLGYGVNTPPVLPRGAPLIFDIDILDIQTPQE